MSIPWDKLASELGFTSRRDMWQKLYARFSIAQLAIRFATSQKTVREELLAAGIEMRSRGGSNNVKLNVTQELLEEIAANGIASVARRLDLDKTTLYKRLYYKHGLKLKDLKKLQEEEPPKDPQSGGGTPGPEEAP